MSLIHPGRTTSLRRFWDETLLDSCKVLVYSEVDDAFNQPVATYTPGSEISCAFNPTATREVQENGEVIITQAACKIPAGTSVVGLDRIRITKRQGAAVTEQDYEIIGEPKLGIAGLVLDLQRVTDGS